MAEVKIKLVSAGGKTYEVEESVACRSQMIKSFVEGRGTEEEIELPNVSSEILEKVIEFSRHYKDSTPLEIEKPITSSVMTEMVPLWDAQFIDLDNETLFELVLAANYLDIKSLFDLASTKVASMLKGKTAEEIRRHFNIDEDFTPEEEARVREENKWAEWE